MKYAKETSKFIQKDFSMKLLSIDTFEYWLLCKVIFSGIAGKDFKFLKSKYCRYLCGLIGLDYVEITDLLNRDPNLDECDTETFICRRMYFKCLKCQNVLKRDLFCKNQLNNLGNRKPICKGCAGSRLTSLKILYCGKCKKPKAYKRFSYGQQNLPYNSRRACLDCEQLTAAAVK
jgi:hypothetical protein